MNKPNILLIMTDQHRADWLGCVGTGLVDTPNIDSIAERGLRFTRAVCNSPVCAPSRCALAGGVYPHRVGASDNKANFPIHIPTYYQKLREAGYRVGVAGKSDLHKSDHFLGVNGDLPIMYHLGFTDPHETEGKMSAAMPKLKQHDDFNLDTFELAGPYQTFLKREGALESFVLNYKRRAGLPVWYADPSVLDSSQFHDSYIGMKTCEFLDNVSNETPWHYFVSFVGPHDPWDAPADYLELYADREYPPSIGSSLEGKPGWIRDKSGKQSKGLTDEKLNRVKQHYAGAIRLIDDWVGKILDVLQRKQLLDNTIVIFCADHGEMLGDHGMLQKSVMYEGSLRIPLIIAEPGQQRIGTCDALAELIDLYPTILDLAGVPYHEERLDGKSLVPLLRGEADIHKSHQISEIRQCRMIFDGRYKWITNVNDISELYDLESDPSELRNIANECPEIAKRLAKQMHVMCK